MEKNFAKRVEFIKYNSISQMVSNFISQIEAEMRLWVEFVLQSWTNVYIFKENKLNYHNRCAMVIFVPRRFQTVENSNQHNFTNTKPFTN